MAELAVVGKPAGQVEGVAKVSGRAAYTADVILPGTLWARALRSPYPHARIVSIDPTAARGLPGVHAVITGADLPATLYGRRMWDMPPLARDRVRFIGERVAAVAAETKEIAEEALNLIAVEYEELPAVFDQLEAMDPAAPLLHPEMGEYRNHQDPLPTGRNVYNVMTANKGDVEQGFRDSDRVFEHAFRTQSHHQGYLEPHATMVQITDDGRVHVWSSNKTPYAALAQLSSLLGLPREQIVVHITHLGADFGGKGSLMDTPVAYYLARQTGRPVKMVMSYTEELYAGNPRNPGVITYKTGVKNDGTLVVMRVRCVWNSGAYQAFLPLGNVPGGMEACGLYRVPNVHIDNIGVYTNCTPRGHTRAPGSPQVAFSLESHLEMVAREMRIDPVEFRLMNMIDEGEQDPTGIPMRDLHGKQTLRAAADRAGWTIPKAANVGRGIALYDRHTGSGNATIGVLIDGDGDVSALTVFPDTGTGAHTVVQQIVAEVLKLPLERVRVVVGDTDGAPNDAGVGGSRVTYVHGQAAMQAAQEAGDQLAAAAAELLGVAPEEVAHEVERYGLRQAQATLPEALEGPASGNASPRHYVSFSDAARAAAANAGGEVRVMKAFDGGSTFGVTSFSAQIAEVEVDPDTGQVRLRKLVSAHDVGMIINPIYHQGQIDGGAVYGLGFALTEELLIDEGKVLNPNLGEYKLPNIQDIPELVTVLVPGGSGPVPYSGKAIGEMSNVPVGAAVANAVADACGVRMMELPITAEKVYRALRGRGEAPAS